MKILSEIARFFIFLLWGIVLLVALAVALALSPLLCVIFLISAFNSKPDEYNDEYTE